MFEDNFMINVYFYVHRWEIDRGDDAAFRGWTNWSVNTWLEDVNPKLA
jgi:hypothetical protein